MTQLTGAAVCIGSVRVSFKISSQYTGELKEDGIKLTRKVGDVGTEEFVAKRIK